MKRHTSTGQLRPGSTSLQRTESASSSPAKRYAGECRTHACRTGPRFESWADACGSIPDRYCGSHGRMPSPKLKLHVDTDCAGCPRMRRSTNGGLVMHGSHLLKTWATAQTIVAPSSGEAEYHGAVKGMCEALGIKGIAKDMGLDLSITLYTDSSAATGIATRKGLGKVKHLETRTPWVQDKIDEGIVAVKKWNLAVTRADREQPPTHFDADMDRTSHSHPTRNRVNTNDSSNPHHREGPACASHVRDRNALMATTRK